MITKSITNKAQFNNCAVADTVKRMPVTHILNHFPHRHSVNLKKACPAGRAGIIPLLFYGWFISLGNFQPKWLYLVVLWLRRKSKNKISVLTSALSESAADRVVYGCCCCSFFVLFWGFLLVLLRSLQHRGFKFLTVLFKKTKKLMSRCAAKLPLVLCFEVINSLMCSVTWGNQSCWKNKKKTMARWHRAEGSWRGGGDGAETVTCCLSSLSNGEMKREWGVSEAGQGMVYGWSCTARYVGKLGRWKTVEGSWEEACSACVALGKWRQSGSFNILA